MPIISGNIYNKYESKNIIVRHLVKNFLNTVYDFLKQLEINKILEVGCGEGYLTSYIKSQKQDIYIQGCDISEFIINKAVRTYPNIPFIVSSIYNMPYREGEFDLLIVCEVLEHLNYPFMAIEEIKRVTTRYSIFSVPLEPIWSILNIMRCKYLSKFGNTPGHLQKWNRKTFVRMLSRYFKVKSIKCPCPWIIVLCEK